MALPVARCNKVHWHHLDQSAQSLPMPKPACTRPQTLTCDLKWLSKGTLVVAWAVGSNSSTSGQSSRGPPPNSSISPTRLLHTVEFSAIAIAAIAQAALLVSTAVCQWHQTSQIADLQDHLSTMDGPGHATATHASTHQHHNQQQQQSVMQLQYQQQPLVPAAHSGLHLVTGSALVVGLLCGAGLRQLQTRYGLVGHADMTLPCVKMDTRCPRGASTCTLGCKVLPDIASPTALAAPQQCGTAWGHCSKQSAACPHRFTCAPPRLPACCRHHLLHSSSGLQPSADAAVRLAALEVTSQQTAAQLTTTARQMDKLQSRVGRRCSTSLGSCQLLVPGPCWHHGMIGRFVAVHDTRRAPCCCGRFRSLLKPVAQATWHH
jgi:hypothetical protein